MSPEILLASFVFFICGLSDLCLAVLNFDHDVGVMNHMELTVSAGFAVTFKFVA